MPTPAAERADNHYVGTLRNRDDRPGRYVEFDRAWYLHHGSTGALRTFSGEELEVLDSGLEESSQVSIRATFVDSDTIRVIDLHLHTGWPRDLASLAGLALVAAVWTASILASFRLRRRH